ncbi:HAD family hydrolase [candidate division KSB1 bacterium]
MRLVLFDIDGTLLLAGPACTGSLREAIQRTYQVDRLTDGYRFGGKTDPQIVVELAAAAGVAPETVSAGLDDALQLYLDLMKQRLPADSRPRLLPGVKDLLGRLEEDDGFTVGLLTGNLEDGARQKLAYFDLNRFFPFGAYGSDSADRSDLPAVALERAREFAGRTFAPSEAVVVGDTEHDVRIARQSGLISLAVATGSRTVEYLAEFGSDHVFPDFSETETVLSALRDGTGNRSQISPDLSKAREL